MTHEQCACFLLFRDTKYDLELLGLSILKHSPRAEMDDTFGQKVGYLPLKWLRLLSTREQISFRNNTSCYDSNIDDYGNLVSNQVIGMRQPGVRTTTL